jgi:hypothetical protein
VSAASEKGSSGGDEPGLLVHDDRRHGVARYASELSAEVARAIGRDLSVAEPSWARGDAPRRIHAQFTDRLWGRSPEEAASRFADVASGRRVSVTLHDVPQDSDGHAFERRIEAYRRVLECVEGVVVNSHHELALLHAVDLRPRTATVIPLPASPPRSARRPEPLDAAAAVLGYVYPGKGHREVIEAVAASRTALAVRALGAPAPGHDADADALVSLGASRGVDVTVSGFLPDRELDGAAARVAVPVVAHQHFSASGSINSWLSAGRRPLVVRSRYTEEMAALRPGTLTLVEPDGLAAAIDRADAAPDSTFLDPATSTRPHPEDTAMAYVDAWREAVR